MHITVLAEKRGKAINRVVENAKILAESLKLDPQLIVGLTPNVKDPMVKEMRRLEAVADLLDAIVQSQLRSGSPIPAPEPAIETSADSAGVSAVTTEDLPAPAHDLNKAAKSKRLN